LVKGGHNPSTLHGSGHHQPVHPLRRLHNLQSGNGSHQSLRTGRRITETFGEFRWFYPEMLDGNKQGPTNIDSYIKNSIAAKLEPFNILQNIEK
jgi:hypothetical protein